MVEARSLRFRLGLLGSFELAGPDGFIDLTNKKLAGLLTYLACTAPTPQPRERLCALLWGSHFDAQAKQNLRQALYRLRKVLGQDAFESDGDIVSLNPAMILSDVDRFQNLVIEGSREALSEAADLYRGELVDDIAVTEEAWSEWLNGERERLRDLVLGALMRLGEIELASDRAERALRAAQRAVALNNVREDAHRLIVRSLAAMGRKAEALKHYQQLVELIEREFNTEPDAASRSLAADLRGTRASAVSPAASEDAERAQPKLGERSVVPPRMADAGGDAAVDAGAGSRHARFDAAPPAMPLRAAGPERRQLTILVCAMPSLMHSPADIDPEEMSDRIARFHRLVADVMIQFDGFVAQSLGDGVHVYFGYPAAHEHDAEQAVRAGLALVDSVDPLSATQGNALRARVGIATGLVVVGEQPGTGNAPRGIAIGEAPNLAAQLQAVAGPGEVVIAASTRRLVGRVFDCRALDLGDKTGPSSPGPAWQVRCETVGVSRFEARQSRGADASSPFVGRLEEMELLLRRWDQAKLGEGRSVLLSGEPGIGKSRIAEILLARLQDEPRIRLRYFCSPHHSHSPLYPFISMLQQAASFKPGSGPGARLDNLEGLRTPRMAAQDLAAIAELLEVPSDGRFQPLEAGPQQKREMMLRALLRQLEGSAAQGPLLIVFEDVHWIDPTSLDLLDRMVARIAELPVLMIVTTRPEFQPTWLGQPHVTMLPLSRLDRRESSSIIDGIAKGKALPDLVVQQILRHADGVPLFIEELTSTLIESGILRETGGSYILDGPLPPFFVPTTLQGSLMARLDRLGPVKEVAQIAAVIGREFAYELIAPLSGLAPEQLGIALERLTASGVVTQRGIPPAASYTFKHALIQDAAYATLLKSRRQQLHASIANLLVERCPVFCDGQTSVTVAANPEVLAHHYTAANLIEPAINQWEAAGKKAAERSAHVEAAVHFANALATLRRLPDSIQRARRELSLEVDRGSQLLATKGNAAPQVEEVFTRACELSQQLGEHHLLFRALYGLMMFCMVRGQLEKAHGLGQRLVECAGLANDPGLLLQAKRPLGLTLCYLGRFAAAKADLEDALGLYDPLQHHQFRFEYGSDPSVLALCNLAWTKWFLGLPDSAVADSRQAIDRANQLDHPHSLGFALCFDAAIRQSRGEPAETFAAAEQAIRVGESYRFPYWSAWGRMLRGWAIGRSGHLQDGIVEIEQGLADYRATGAELMRPHGLMMYAEMVAAAGAPRHALALLDEAAAIVGEAKSVFLEPELLRLRGEFLLAATGEISRAADHFRSAGVHARELGARGLELRAVLSLVSATQGAERLAALRKLSNLCKAAVEGFDTPDFMTASRLLGTTAQ